MVGDSRNCAKNKKITRLIKKYLLSTLRRLDFVFYFKCHIPKLVVGLYLLGDSLAGVQHSAVVAVAYRNTYLLVRQVGELLGEVHCKLTSRCNLLGA